VGGVGGRYDRWGSGLNAIVEFAARLEYDADRLSTRHGRARRSSAPCVSTVAHESAGAADEIALDEPGC